MRTTPTMLDEEVSNIIAKAPLYIMPDISMMVVLPDEDIPINFIRRYELKREFVSSITDTIFIDFLLDIPTFLKIYDNKDNVELVITFKIGTTNISKRYKAIVRNKLPKAHSSELRSEAASLETQDMITVTLETIDPLTLALKNTTVSGVYHGYDVTTLIRGLICSELNNMTVLGRLLKYRFNIYEADNEEVYSNILIAPFSKGKVIRLPYLLQTGDYGVYDSGIGIYFTNMESTTSSIEYDINVYPTHDFDRYDNDINMPKLLLINSSIPEISKNNYNAYFDIDTYKVIVSDVTFNDVSDEVRYNNGTGIINEYSDLTSNKELISVTDTDILFENNTYEYLNIDEDISDYAKYIETDQDNNIFKYKSKINTSLGVTCIIRIPNMDPSFIFPCMSIKYMFISDGVVVETTGIVHGVSYVIEVTKELSITVLLVTLKKIKR